MNRRRFCLQKGCSQEHISLITIILDFQNFQISSKSVKRLQRYSDLTVFFKWWSSAILDLLGAYWDHPQRPLDGLHRCAKFGRNRCRSFDNMKLSIFCPFGLKTPIHAPKIGVFGAFHPKMRSNVNETNKRHICWS